MDKSLWPIENGRAIRFVVDGHEFPNEESSLLGDGEYPPFWVFDVEEQEYLGVNHLTRAAAQEVADRVNELEV
jgi:hypothetical protein